MSIFVIPDGPTGYAPKRARDRIDHIASLVASLTYGEMLQFAKALMVHSNEVTRENLPDLLHQWSTNHGRAPEYPEEMLLND